MSRYDNVYVLPHSCRRSSMYHFLSRRPWAGHQEITQRGAIGSPFSIDIHRRQTKMEQQPPSKITQKDLQTIAQFLRSIRYGSVTISIQDGKIVQIERSEKLRLN